MTDFYNDNDPFACAWMRELIRADCIPEGKVDERSIADLQGSDLQGYRRVHLFAGIGGWAYALRLAGWDESRPVWTGSCPCQPFSVAGKKKGQADERHLWPVFLRLIRECNPSTIFGEQVGSDDGYRWLARVRDDLEEEGYAVGCADLRACSEGAPHIRSRLFWMANSGKSASKRDAGEVLGTEAGVGATRQLNGNSSERSCNGGAAIGMADTNGGIASNGELQRGREHGQQPQDGGTGDGMEYAESDGRRQGRAESIGGSIASGCGTERLGDSTKPRRSRRKNCRTDRDNATEGTRGIESERTVATGGMGNTDQTGFFKLRSAVTETTEQQSVERGSDVSHWSGCELVYCQDGKYRRVKPGIFPLASRIPGRVGMLRGAGNSIVPQVAATFIKAIMEILPDCS